MSPRRARDDARPKDVRKAIALALEGGGVLLVVIAIAMGRSVRGLSAATGLHALGVLAMIAAGLLLGRRLVAYVQGDPKGWPVVGLLAVGFLVAAGWLVQRASAEVAAGKRWDELLALVASDDAAAGPRLVKAFPDVPDADLRLRYVKRLGELHDTRTEAFLRTTMLESPDPAMRRAAAEGYGALGGPGGPGRIRDLIDRLKAPGENPEVLIALRRASGADAGSDFRSWRRWRLLGLLADGTADSVRAVIQESGSVDEGLYRELRAGLRELRDPALRPVFEGMLTEELPGQWKLDRRGTAVLVLGQIGGPASFQALRDAFTWSRTAEAANEIAPEEADGFRKLVGDSLRRIAGTDVLDANRWGQVYDFFVALLDDGEAHVRVFGSDQLERMTRAKLGLDRAAWERWREDRLVEAWVAAGDVPLLVRDLEARVGEKDIERSARTIRALAGMADERGKKAVRAVALRKAAEPRIRTIAIDALAGTSALTKADILRLLEGEQDVAVLRSVIPALVSHDEDAVVKVLHERFLVEESDVVRRAILEALRRMTADAVFEALVDAVRDEVPQICEGAAEELEKRSGKRFGVDPEKWEAWYRETFKK